MNWETLLKKRLYRYELSEELEEGRRYTISTYTPKKVGVKIKDKVILKDSFTKKKNTFVADKSLLNTKNLYVSMDSLPEDKSMKVKLERGTMSTDWTEAPEDVEAHADAVAKDEASTAEAEAKKHAEEKVRLEEERAKLEAENNLTEAKEHAKALDAGARKIANEAKGLAEGAVKDLGEGVSFYAHADNIGLVDMNPDGTFKSIISIGEKGPYIGGENIVLDGKTIVDDDFTVTGTMLAEDAVIDSLSGRESNFVRSAWNGISNSLTIESDGITMAETGTDWTSRLENAKYRMFHRGKVTSELLSLRYNGDSPFTSDFGAGIRIAPGSFFTIGGAYSNNPRAVDTAINISSDGDVIMNNIKPHSSYSEALRFAATTGDDVRLSHSQAPSLTGMDMLKNGNINILNNTKLFTRNIFGYQGDSIGLRIQQGKLGNQNGVFLSSTHGSELSGLFIANNGKTHLSVGGGYFGEFSDA